VSAISFADDIKHQPRSLRAIVQLFAVILFFWKVNLFQQEWYWWPIALVFTIGIVNAYNFMDGINGITAAYSFTILASLYFLNREIGLFDENLVICLALGNIVFSFFNFRVKAKCFAGDVGSVSMAFSLLFLTMWSIITTGNFIFILFFALYGVDSVLTILHRLLKGENIFEPHRQHLFQYLANERKMPHLLVSALYMLGQAIISLGVLLVWKKEPVIQFAFSAIALLVPTIIYISIKYWILRQLENMPSSV
jgi:UDP-N-acetylmuramyl pentapeptide phosphotransferase/UDP-N-acetylglucosamine-1-phosphate transferase